MKFSKFFAPTLRDDPSEAEVVSHRLLLRAGFIRRVTSGVYDFLPLGLKVLRRIESVIREEMNHAGAQELLMPLVQPAELWHASGRWAKYGPELLRFHDRHDHSSCLGPTHEEVVCDLVARELKSYRQLPLNLYQIQTKFRDEVRPRFGLMRGREFIMKDAYSFHADEEDLAREYDSMFDAYTRIFTRLGLKFRAVEADTGSIGGNASHEFHVLADSGEDVIAHCDTCNFAANVEMARSRRSLPPNGNSELAEVETPGVSAVGEVASFLRVESSMMVKTLMYSVSGGPHDGAVVAACLRGDDEAQAIKLAHVLEADEVVLADQAGIDSVGGVTGFVGPKGLKTLVYADLTLKDGVGLVAGANRENVHVVGLVMARDVPDAIYVDLRNARAGDGCPQCDGRLELSRGIEVGHVFALGRRYAEPMEVVFQDKAGQRSVATMGCYGIGVSRLVAAIVEQCHDDSGIRWPSYLAPFHVSLVSLGTGEEVMQVSKQLYTVLQEAGLDVLWDDRNERAGVKFKDAELMGIPTKVVVGERGLSEGRVEVGLRGEKPSSVSPSDVPDWLAGVLAGAT